MEPSRLEAARTGSSTYKGRPCPRHPESDRYVASGQCRACAIARATAHNKNQREQIRRAKAGAG